MSQDRVTEILNYLTAISRDVGELRAEIKQFKVEANTRFDQIEGRLTNMEREQRLQGQQLDRIGGMLLLMRGDVGELQDRVSALEGKQG